MKNEIDPVQKGSMFVDIPLNSPRHPCFNCGNRQQDTKAVINNDTVCLSGFNPSPNCRHFYPNSASYLGLKI